MIQFNIKILALATLLILFGCSEKELETLYESDNLRVKQITKNTFLHITYLNTEDYGKVACNGMIVIKNEEAIVVDTPTDSIGALELINWIQSDRKTKIIAVVPTHFHVDCLGSLNTFHKKGIPSYANEQTIKLAKASGFQIPQNGFDNSHQIDLDGAVLSNSYPGEGHTKDNIVVYFEPDKVLFGGCLIKSVGASKGNLNDANQEEWSTTVEKVKSNFGEAQFVIPGHGEVGGQELLDYTIELFK
ncbi:MAG: subclass B1 metallo-beta-lactamase [Cyclobacteriaceae bacterium]